MGEMDEVKNLLNTHADQHRDDMGEIKGRLDSIDNKLVDGKVKMAVQKTEIEHIEKDLDKEILNREKADEAIISKLWGLVVGPLLTVAGVVGSFIRGK